jgi:transposase-like protein
MLGFLVALLIMTALLSAGIVLIVQARRRGVSHPACGECGYDVTATVGTTDRCPECGKPFLEVGITPPGRRTRPVMLSAGIVMVVLAVGCFGSGVVAQISYVQAQRARSQAMAAMARQQAAIARAAEAQAAQAAAEAASRERDEEAASEQAVRIEPGDEASPASSTTESGDG